MGSKAIFLNNVAIIANHHHSQMIEILISISNVSDHKCIEYLSIGISVSWQRLFIDKAGVKKQHGEAKHCSIWLI